MPSVQLPDMTVANRITIPPAINPLQLAGQAANVSNALYQNKLFGAKQAAGQDFQASIGPNGQLDQPGFNSRLANDPNAAMYAQQASTEALQNVSAALQNKGLTLDQGINRMKYANTQLSSLLATGKPVSQSELLNTIAGGIGDGVYSAKDAASVAATIPTDPQERMAWIKQHAATSQAGLDAIMPHLSVLNNGQQQSLINTNPGASPVGTTYGTMQNQLTPMERQQPITVPGSAGQPVVTSVGNVADHGGQYPTAEGGFAPVVQGQTSIQAAANSAYGQGLGQSAGSSAIASNIPQARAALSDIMANLDKASTGPLSDVVSNVGGAIGQLGLTGMDAATANQELAKGNANLIAQRVETGLGVPTDSKLSLMSSATPGTGMTKEAIRDMGARINGDLNYAQARANAQADYVQKYGPSDTPQFTNEWNKRFPSSVVFAWGQMNQTQRLKYWGALKTNADKTAFGQQLTAAQSLMNNGQ